MGKEKERNKKRIEKGAGRPTATEFIGFSAFATGTATDASASSSAAVVSGDEGQGLSTAASASTSSKINLPLQQWAPVYTGSDSSGDLQLLFAKLQKRDSTTKTKGLQDLKHYLASSDNPKKLRVEAFVHYAYLDYHKLQYDSQSSVRSACLQVWISAITNLPKAFMNLISYKQDMAGRLYASQTDPAAEVRQQSELLISNVKKDVIDSDGANAPHIRMVWNEGVWLYVKCQLSYGRPSNFYSQVFATTKKSCDWNSLTDHQRDSYEETLDRIVASALETMELWIRETYNTSNRDDDDDQTILPDSIDIPSHTACWWKTMKSQKGSIRRKTYQLLTTTALKQPAWVFVENGGQKENDVIQMLPQILLSEKDAANLPTLLETLLTVLMAYNNKMRGSDGTDGADNEKITSLYQKPLIKILKKALFGARVETWGPMLLPLTASIPAFASNPLPLLQAAYNGRSACLAGQDSWLLMSAVIECVTFALLRRRNNTSDNSDGVTTLPDARDVAQIWLDVWDEAISAPPPPVSGSRNSLSRAPVTPPGMLSSPPVAAVSIPPQLHLLNELAKTLTQLQQATNTKRTNCAWHGDIEEWFWGTAASTSSSGAGAGFNIPSQCHPLALAHVLRALHREQEDNENKTTTTTTASLLVVPRLKAHFIQDLSRYQTSSGSVPSTDSYQLYKEIFNYCGPAAVIDDLQTFIMNDVLRWSIIHTSALPSNQIQSLALVRYDFILLSSALLAAGGEGERRRSLWEAILREVILAQCSLKLLGEGIRVLVQKEQQQEGRKSIDNDRCSWIRCPTLDRFALDVGLLRYPPPTEGQDSPETRKEQSVAKDTKPDVERLKFLRLCLGIEQRDAIISCTSMLIGRDVLTEWIQSECPVISPLSALEPDHSPTTLLEALVEAVRSSSNNKSSAILESSEIDRILLKCWYRGGRQFTDEALEVFNQDEALCRRFISTATDSIRQQLAALCAKTQKDSSVAPALSETWSHRAWRLIQATKCLEDENTNKSFKLIGLAETERWQNNPDLLYLCTMSLFEQASVPIISGEDTTKLMVSILLNTSEGCADAPKAARAKFRDDRCACLLNAMGGRNLGFLEDLIRPVIEAVSAAIQSDNNDEKALLQRGIAVLSQIVGILFFPIAAPNAGKIEASTIVEGSQLWYITDPENQSARERVQIGKVHYDSQAGYYFTIRLNRNGEIQERQTVVDRLRRDPNESPGTHGVHAGAIPVNESLQRAKIRDLIYQKLLDRYFSLTTWTSMVPELVNVLCCAVGLGPERGAGSVHYGLFQLLRSAQHTCIDALNGGDFSSATNTLWTLSLALGYGFNVPSTGWMFEEWAIDLSPLNSAILEFYDKNGASADLELNDAVLAWLSTSIMHISKAHSTGDLDHTTLHRILTLLFDLGKDSFENEKLEGFSGKGLVACRATYEGYRVLSTFSNASDEQIQNSAISAAVYLVQTFACRWENEIKIDDFGVPGADWTRYSYFPELMKLSQTSRAIQDILAAAVINDPDTVEVLSANLFFVLKQRYSFKLLHSFASTATPIFDGAPLRRETARRLKDEWTDGLEDEEAEEIEEDIEIVSRFLPRRMMDEVEIWDTSEEVYEEPDDATAVGRLLTWLITLQIVDVVAPADFRFRPAFLSYFIQCGAANAALNIALLNDECINAAKGKIAPSLLHVEQLFQDEYMIELSNISSLVLFQTVEVLPSLSRRWWEDSCPKVYISDVQSFVETYVAPEIFKRELDRIKDNTQTFGSMLVRSSSVSREVTASYVQDEFTLSVWIMLPKAFPLRSAEVDCSKTLGVPPKRWKRWSLQITQMLNNQGGTLQDALLLWKDNVDKEFEGIEPCPVCYSVLHVKTHKLPVLQCKTCQNRFHFDCLTQWFRSSGKTQCVLCQQPWQGTRVQ